MSGIYIKFCNIADTQKDKVAIISGEDKITYNELRKKIDCFKAFFMEQNISNRNIAILASKSEDSVAAIIGIIASGNVFMPLHKDWAEDKINDLLIFAEVPVVLVDDSMLGTYSHSQINHIGLRQILDKESDNLTTEMKKDTLYYDPCYLYFTSGSTGEPKGVLGSQKSLIHFIEWEQECFCIKRDDRVSALTNMIFDPFLRDVFVPLLIGATVCIPNMDETFIDMNKLHGWMEECKISVIHIVPSLFRELLPYMKTIEDIPSKLRYVFFAGEVLYSNIISDFYKLSSSRTKLVNLYGPTETTLAKFYHVLQDRDLDETVVPVGKIQSGASFELVSENGISASGDNQGEIYIHTSYSSYGYYKNEAKNKERFSTDNNGDTVFKTGDIGYLRDDGELVCVGRNDDQIKIRGVKVSLKEIESALLSIEGIEAGTVLKKTEKSGKYSIVAFYVSREIKDNNRIRSQLEALIPLYMIPPYLVWVDEIPHLPNGKTDRRKLLELDITQYRVAIKAPSNDLEYELQTIWQDVLEYDDIGTDTDFFVVGGYSITAVKLALAINRRFMTDMLPSDVYRLRTIEAMSDFVNEYKNLALTSEENDRKKCDSCVATPMQVGIYMSELGVENSTIYNMPAAIRIIDKFEPEKIEDTLNKLFARHPSLGYTFSFTDGQLIQHKGKKEKVSLTIKDLREEQNVDINTLFSQYIKPFDLETGPLFRCILFRIGELEQILFWDTHHIISDGLSEEIMKVEILSIYMGNELSEEVPDYIDYASSEKSHFISEKDREYWKREFEVLPQSLELPTDKTRTPIRSLKGANYSRTLERGLTKSIDIAASYYRTTPYVITLAAFYSTLAMYSGQSDIVVGTVFEGDRGEEFKNTVGTFIKFFALRNRMSDEKDSAKLISETARCVNGLMEHNSCTYSDLLRMINVGTDRSRNPLFDVSFFFQNYIKATDTELAQALGTSDVKFEMIQVNRHMAKYDLTFYIMPLNGRYDVNVEYSSNLFEEEYIKGFVECYEDRLRAIVSTSSSHSIEMSQKFKEKLIEYGRTVGQENKMRPVHKLFSEKAIECPDMQAVVFHEEVLTYRELDKKSDLLSKVLISAGSQKGDIIGIFMERSHTLVVSILGVLKAGCAYLPLDPDYPKERISDIIEDSKCELLIVDNVRADCNIRQIEVEKLSEKDVEGVSDEICENRSNVDMESLSYVIYTSGSTGKPKGVMLKHINEVNFIEGMSDIVDFSNNKRILCITTFSFDIFVLETMAPLLNGATVFMADKDEQYDVERLNKLIKTNAIQLIQMTPSRLKMFMEKEEQAKFLKEVKVVLVGGEPVEQTVTDAVFEINPNVRVLDVYGPTETCVWSTVKELKHRKEITIGRPIKNTDVYVLNDNLVPMPYGVPGQLYIGGAGLARGYFGRDDLTNEAFIDNPFIAGKRIYKTGDYVKWGPRYELRFLGRKDAQIKLRGYRVELTDVEANIMQLDGIKTCACVVKKQADGSDKLMAYYLSDAEWNNVQLHGQLKEKLPSYMIPSHFIRLDTMPMTPNGKVNKKELASRIDEATFNENKSVRPDKTAGVIYDIWKDILGNVDFDMDTSFYDMGGNSFLFVRMFTSINELYPNVMSIGELFSYPTVEKIARLIDERSKRSLATVKIDMQPSLDVKRGIRISEITLKKQECDSIATYCNRMNISPRTLWCSMFAMMISHIARATQIKVYLLDDTGRIAEIAIDFNKMENPQKVFTYFDMSCCNCEWLNSDEYVGSSEKNKISLGFGNTTDNSIMELIDMILNVIDDGSSIVLKATDKKLGAQFIEKLSEELYKSTLKLVQR